MSVELRLKKEFREPIDQLAVEEIVPAVYEQAPRNCDVPKWSIRSLNIKRRDQSIASDSEKLENYVAKKNGYISDGLKS
ncbi:hypothetical protein P7K49_025658 [Saguinus oedipus]|uniref:Uncharacterized protein n=1 Tax=Saguinus oedipus TaxID=9490 RepID=A0ABQ9UII3_SAGOE|nr:hypothetical protein P7K49_025658 [Saguinus oedipus]